MPVDLEELRHRTAVVGALLLLAVSATLLLGFLDVGLEPTLAVAAVPTFAAAVALLSVRRDGDVELAGRRLGPTSGPDSATPCSPSRSRSRTFLDSRSTRSVSPRW